MESRILAVFLLMAVTSLHGAPTDAPPAASSTAAPLASSTTPAKPATVPVPTTAKPPPKPVTTKPYRPPRPAAPAAAPLAAQPQPQLPNVEPTSVPDCQNTTDVYDQSQYGTDNYRVNIKGFTFLLAPSDTILAAAMLMSGMDEKALPAALNPMKQQQHKPEGQNRSEKREKMSKLFHFLKRLQDNGKSE